MALALTSFSPTTGPCTGGTPVAIVGTGLTAVTSVMFGDVEGTIDTSQTNTALLLHVISPAISNDAAGAKKITVLDSATPTEAQSSGSFTYTAVTLPSLDSTSATKWKMDVDSSVAQDGSAYIPIRAISEFQHTFATTTVDDSTYDDVDADGVFYGSDAKVQFKWGATFKINRKRAAAYTEDPGQRLLYLAHDQVGAAGKVRVRWYDRNGHGSEAYEGHANVEWSDDGGSTTALSFVSITLMGQGPRTKITNPVS